MYEIQSLEHQSWLWNVDIPICFENHSQNFSKKVSHSFLVYNYLLAFHNYAESTVAQGQCAKLLSFAIFGPSPAPHCDFF